jgi:hypothetical protein
LKPLARKPFVPLFSGPVIFVEDGHEYYLEEDGETKKIPSLSSVLRRQGLTQTYDKDIPPHVLAQAAARGTEVHAAIANEIAGAAVEISEPSKYLFENAKKLYVENKMDVVYNEVPFFNPVFSYCATPDFVGYLNGRPAILDWKTVVTVSAFVGFQLAGQALCFRHPEEFDLYVGDLRRGQLIKFDSTKYLTPARVAFQLWNDVQDIVDPG